MIKLADFRPRAQGMPDLLPWAALVAPGVVLNKDGSLLAAWKVRGQDTASATFDEMDWISGKANSALRQLGNGWMLHMNAIREYSRAYPPEDSSRFPDPVTQMIDDERREFFGADWCYTTTTVLSLTYKPNVQAARIARHAQNNQETDLFSETMEYFQLMLHQVEDTLATVLRMERLQERETTSLGLRFEVSDLLSHLQQCLTGENQLIRVPPIPMYLDAVLGAGDLMLDGTTPMLGDQHISVVSLGGFPLESWPAMLSKLDGLSMPYRFAIRYLFLDQWDAVKEINKYRKGWQQSMTRVIDQLTSKKNPRINRDAQNMHEDAEQAEMEVRSGAVGAGFLTASLVLMDENKRVLTEMSREVRRQFMSLGFSGRIETINTLEAWLGSHPGNSYADVRRPLVNTMNLADFLPLSSAWTGHAYNPCPFYPEYSRSLAVLTTDGSTPYRLNLHEGDLGHTVVLGPTGSGKSTLLALIAAQFRAYENSSIFVFDKGLSMYALAAGANGDHYDIGRDALSFAPLQRIDESEEEFAFAANWIANLAELQKMPVLPGHRNAIHQALDTLRHNPENMRSLTDFWHVIQDQELKEALRHYTKLGALGHLEVPQAEAQHAEHGQHGQPQRQQPPEGDFRMGAVAGHQPRSSHVPSSRSMRRISANSTGISTAPSTAAPVMRRTRAPPVSATRSAPRSSSPMAPVAAAEHSAPNQNTVRAWSAKKSSRSRSARPPATRNEQAEKPSGARLKASSSTPASSAVTTKVRALRLFTAT